MKSNVFVKALVSGLTAVLLLGITAGTGCSKKVTVDTVKLEYSFQEADESTQATVNEAIDAIEKGEAKSALEKLKTVSADPKLTAEQKTTVAGVIAELEKH
jgi:hypothetical protein